VTVSIGVSSASGDGAVDIERMQREADRALYAAKGGGRDRIVYARPEPSLIFRAEALPS
jgi:PleD family two-component response regulator